MAARIYTRTGDKGQTGLFDGTRVTKDDPRIECLGAIDEVNAFIGLLRTQLILEHPWQERLHRIQQALMASMAYVATPGTARENRKLPPLEDHAAWIEPWIDAIDAKLATASNRFLVPGGNEIAALCHVVRTQLRRAERRLVAIHSADPIPDPILRFLNRLSDLFFKLSREEMQRAGLDEEPWEA